MKYLTTAIVLSLLLLIACNKAEPTPTTPTGNVVAPTTATPEPTPTTTTPSSSEYTEKITITTAGVSPETIVLKVGELVVIDNEVSGETIVQSSAVSGIFTKGESTRIVKGKAGTAGILKVMFPDKTTSEAAVKLVG